MTSSSHPRPGTFSVSVRNDHATRRKLTIAAGWVRYFGQSQELVLASDSRLRWAGAWDSCPKLFALPRSDAAIAFAGDTMWAYPIIAQTANHIAAYRPSTRRENDLLEA